MTDHEDLKFYIDDRIREGLESIYEKIQDDLFEIVKQHVQEFTGDILTGEQAAQMLGVSPRTLAAWAIDGALPRYRIGTKWYWRTSDIISKLDEQSQQSD